MRLALQIIIVIIAGYLVGCFNLSYILSRMKGYDIRKHGSGNAGASNVVITMGKKAGLIVALFDIFKAYLLIKLAIQFSIHFGPVFYGIGFIAAVSVIIGNIFPFYLQFKGGKGFAAIGGSVLACDVKLFFILITIAIVVVLIIDYICFIPMAVSVIFPAICVIHPANGNDFFYGNYWALLFLIAAVAIWYKHMENIRRIKEGKELKLSFLWNRKKEAERMGVGEEDDGVNYPFGSETANRMEAENQKKFV